MATLKELMDGLSPEARERVEARAAELSKEIAEHETDEMRQLKESYDLAERSGTKH
ncbi:hypothetical protein [Pantoea sp. aB]|jgi:hypothetical protein|uniref:hypothetical protein n=1 Tax=Pantoea sp. aB TaxID=517433 RepID=UPI0001E0B439|nr:hypothetical protein [Pantoea sp. aB]EFM17745.1 transcriptional regulator [Pantoea sp. aB]